MQQQEVTSWPIFLRDLSNRPQLFVLHTDRNTVLIQFGKNGPTGSDTDAKLMYEDHVVSSSSSSSSIRRSVNVRVAAAHVSPSGAMKTSEVKLTHPITTCSDTLLQHVAPTRCPNTLPRHIAPTRCPDMLFQHVAPTRCPDMLFQHVAPTRWPNTLP